jgi:hypothetical protein
MKKAYHKMLMSGGILIGDVNNYVVNSSWTECVNDFETPSYFI